jgi:zinc transporter ZupT
MARRPPTNPRKYRAHQLAIVQRGVRPRSGRVFITVLTFIGAMLSIASSISLVMGSATSLSAGLAGIAGGMLIVVIARFLSLLFRMEYNQRLQHELIIQMIERSVRRY